jgi:hypothetical protein
MYCNGGWDGFDDPDDNPYDLDDLEYWYHGAVALSEEIKKQTNTK